MRIEWVVHIVIGFRGISWKFAKQSGAPEFAKWLNNSISPHLSDRLIHTELTLLDASAALLHRPNVFTATQTKPPSMLPLWQQWIAKNLASITPNDGKWGVQIPPMVLNAGKAHGNIFFGDICRQTGFLGLGIWQWGTLMGPKPASGTTNGFDPPVRSCLLSIHQIRTYHFFDAYFSGRYPCKIWPTNWYSTSRLGSSTISQRYLPVRWIQWYADTPASFTI